MESGGSVYEFLIQHHVPNWAAGLAAMGLLGVTPFLARIHSIMKARREIIDAKSLSDAIIVANQALALGKRLQAEADIIKAEAVVIKKKADLNERRVNECETKHGECEGRVAVLGAEVEAQRNELAALRVSIMPPESQTLTVTVTSEKPC